MNPISGYASVSKYKFIANNFAGKGGSLYKFQVPRNKLYSTRYSSFVGGIEGEYLARGGTRIFNVTKLK